MTTSSKKPGGLGRGLGALIPQKQATSGVPAQGASAASAAPTPAPRIIEVEKVVERVIEKSVANGKPLMMPIDRVRANPNQPRTVFNHGEIEDLANSIKEHGILQPLVVTPVSDGDFEIIAGERRFRAAKLAGLDIVPIIVHETDDQRDKLVLALIENIQRADLNPLEEARAYDRLSREFGYTQEVIAQSVGKARSTIANIMRLLDLPVEIQEALASGMVAAGSARAFLALPDAESQLAMFRKMMKERHATTREIERATRQDAGKPPRDPIAAAAEEQLRTVFGTRVEVKKKAGAGSIVISFYSDDEFNQLMRQLNRS
jgi:ParB family chromosome partitioning protein